ncbi:hypothetical protein [uncultured Hoeflea sp.]|uniref:hypothetical protein n=1 Tax=uncultured Hoeflea sp. TaxID=538666 RepID=UPI0026348B60|nr:hypothetical protein [uncultured Hoeflea sp.]
MSPVLISLAVALPLTGCGTYMVAKTMTGAGSLVAGTAVGAVKLTGKATGTAAGAITGVGRDDD